MTPDEVRSGIAANPQTPTERALLINGAIENNMANEIPDDWGIGIGQGPDDPVESEVHNYGVITTATGVIYVMLYTDGTLVLEDDLNRVIYEFSNETSWANNELLSLEDNLKWARQVALDSSDLRFVLGERPIDPVMLMHTWRTGITGPGGSPPIIVGIVEHSPEAPGRYDVYQNYNANSEMVVGLRIQDRNYPITDLDELDDAIKDIERVYKLLRSDFE